MKDPRMYNVQFVMSHSVITTVVPLDDDKEFDLDEVIEAAKNFLSWDGVDVSRA